MMRQLVSVYATVLLAACGDGPTEITAGTRMSVADQVAIEASLATVADELERTGRTAADSLLADLTRIGARLVRLQGREGALALSGLPTPPASATMSAASIVVADESPGGGGGGGGGGVVHVLIAWEGLDHLMNTVERALVLVVPGSSAPGGGTFPLEPGSLGSAARIVDFSPGGEAGFARNGAGSLTVTSAAFRGSCPGLVNTRDARCEVGRQTVAGGFQATLEGAPPAAVSWPGAELPAFRLSTR